MRVYGAVDTEHAEQYDLTVDSEEGGEGKHRATHTPPAQAARAGHKANARHRNDDDDDDDVRSAPASQPCELGCGAVASPVACSAPQPVGALGCELTAVPGGTVGIYAGLRAGEQHARQAQ